MIILGVSLCHNQALERAQCYQSFAFSPVPVTHPLKYTNIQFSFLACVVSLPVYLPPACSPSGVVFFASILPGTSIHIFLSSVAVSTFIYVSFSPVNNVLPLHVSPCAKPYVTQHTSFLGFCLLICLFESCSLPTCPDE
ncbi:hypothetical protein FGIG_07676 [Fasciola gigantica]|uniref:Uncharacterized protein n=1 Tax=Fasciola gigantica TaxID=46835 RepID=A0A504YG29_FASGI|nr:hypothetical protein FGIG_07676 [Fasciola gigantica]